MSSGMSPSWQASFELDLDEIAQTNLDKLLSRRRRGVLSGDGDDR